MTARELLRELVNNHDLDMQVMMRPPGSEAYVFVDIVRVDSDVFLVDGTRTQVIVLRGKE